MNRLFIIFLLLASLTSCQNTKTLTEVNPPSEGFNLEASDENAIAIADQVMEAMGGRQAWDETRYIRWTFFGRRTLLWDKQQNRVRIDFVGDSTVYILDMNNQTGLVQQKGEPIYDEALRDSLLENALSIWINDSYWLVMPFKLKDSGVTLTYVNQDVTLQGTNADVLSLTFEGVGRTPQNKYHVYVDPASYQVVQWDYYRNATDTVPAMSTPWIDYQPYGSIQLSGNRGRAKLENIGVYTNVPESVFTSLDAVDVSTFQN